MYIHFCLYACVMFSMHRYFLKNEQESVTDDYDSHMVVSVIRILTGKRILIFS